MPASEPLCMRFFLPKTQLLDLGFLDGFQDVREPPGSERRILCNFAYVRHSGFTRLTERVVSQGCFKTTHSFPFFRITLVSL